MSHAAQRARTVPHEELCEACSDTGLLIHQVGQWDDPQQLTDIPCVECPTCHCGERLLEADGLHLTEPGADSYCGLGCLQEALATCMTDRGRVAVLAAVYGDWFERCIDASRPDPIVDAMDELLLEELLRHVTRAARGAPAITKTFSA